MICGTGTFDGRPEDRREFRSRSSLVLLRDGQCVFEEQSEMVHGVAPPVGGVADKAAERADTSSVSIACIVAAVFQRAQSAGDCRERGLFCQEFRHFSSRVDALFQLAIQLQYEIVAVVDHRETLVDRLEGKAPGWSGPMSMPCERRAYERRPVRRIRREFFGGERWRATESR